jgi:hypothetical protein
VAHFSLIRSGGWANLTVDGGLAPPVGFTPPLGTLGAELEALDAGQYASLNGNGGGTWNPAAQIVLGGTGLRVDGPCALSNVGNSSLSGNGVMTYGHSVTVNSGGTLEATDGAAIVDGTSTWNLAGSGALALTGSASMSMIAGTSMLLAGQTNYTSTCAITYDGRAAVVSTAQTYPTGFKGGEVLTLGYDGIPDFTTVFAADDQQQSSVLARINAAAGFSFAASVSSAKMKLTGVATGAAAQVRVTGGTASVFAALGLTVGTTKNNAIRHNGSTASGTLNRTGQTIMSGNSGAYGYRSHTYSDATQNVDPGLYDYIFIPHTAADRIYTCNLPANNAPVRCVFSHMIGSGFGWTVKNHAGVAISPSPLGNFSWFETIFDPVAVDWVSMGFGSGG